MYGPSGVSATVVLPLNLCFVSGGKEKRGNTSSSLGQLASFFPHLLTPTHRAPSLLRDLWKNSTHPIIIVFTLIYSHEEGWFALDVQDPDFIPCVTLGPDQHFIPNAYCHPSASFTPVKWGQQQILQRHPADCEVPICNGNKGPYCYLKEMPVNPKKLLGRRPILYANIWDKSARQLKGSATILQS